MASLANNTFTSAGSLERWSKNLKTVELFVAPVEPRCAEFFHCKA
jgi:hypothetical protein